MVAVSVALGLAAAAVVGFVVLRDGGVERFCSRPEGLQSRDGVTLTADAMDAFHRAEATAGHIQVVQSYRTCRQQARACERICGRRSCPERCAPPGLSWHQRGLAIDIAQVSLDRPGVVAALEHVGWCQAVPATDPGHFSFDGCH